MVKGVGDGDGWKGRERWRNFILRNSSVAEREHSGNTEAAAAKQTNRSDRTGSRDPTGGKNVE
jgi:hypothetical protein